MLKRIFGMLILFVFIITGLVGYQWLSYQRGESAVVRMQTSPLNYEIKVTHQAGRLKVEQNVQNIQQQQFYVQIPKGSSDVLCEFDSKSKCEWIGDPKSKQLNVEGAPKVTLTYELSLNEEDTSRWLEDWYIKFLDEELQPYAANMSVTVSEETNTAIAWAAGALNLADVKREYLRYFAWEKQNTTSFPLYMSEEPLAKLSNDKVLSYLSESATYNLNNSWFENLPDYSGLTVVSTTKSNVKLAPLLVVLPVEINQTDADEEIALAYILDSKRPSTEDITWIWKVFPPLVNQQITVDGKVGQMVEQLQTQLNEEELERFIIWLFEKETELVTLQDLDDALSYVTGRQTQFFSINGEISAPLEPLYFVDERDVYFGGKQINQNWHAVYQRGKMYLPLVQVVKAVGFEVTEFEGEETFLVRKGGNTWRLFLNESFFIYNQEDYGLTSKPLEKINGHVYISEKWFEEILRLEIVKRDEGINIQ
ncbi:stalk domain-containing protein [Bacillus solimangrovi]|uniref:Copper amine oxidase-like N-terminal domain-containing protein n=1 Tax=Bacillus solimangrovi TaxID=1305675 RepID=A0A1E5LIN8_9BACI|nr:stalk domain-containing protein [Bacillus solimangrovi]OEH93931.1 hypothetical protein BFG57_10710 [Bacillus solimangrovi]